MFLEAKEFGGILMDYKLYCKYVTETVLNFYPDYEVKVIINKLNKSKVINNSKRVKIGIDKNDILDVSMTHENREKLKIALEFKEAQVIKTIEEMEFFKAYRHSAIFH